MNLAKKTNRKLERIFAEESIPAPNPKPAPAPKPKD